MPQYVVTPWKFHHELVQVRRELYHLGGLNSHDQRHGVDLVLAWSLRGKLPHAVESTALLVDAILHHGTNNSTFSIRATYSAAFSRFVTGFCDVQQDGVYRKSMYEVAKIINMPASFVELRHEATHEELPSLVRLSRFAKLGLDWLWQYYWVKIEDDTSSKQIVPESTVASPEEIQALLGNFVKAMRVEIKTKAKKQVASNEACFGLVRLCGDRVENLKLLVKLMVKEKMLVPTDRELNDSMVGAFHIWDRLLRLLVHQQPHFLVFLLNYLVEVLASTSLLPIELDPFRQALHEWVLHILTDEAWKSTAHAEDWTIRETLVKAAVLDPNTWLVSLARTAYEHAGPDFQEQWHAQLDNL